MELLLTVGFLVLFSYLVGRWADSKGRNAWGWGIAAFLLSPLLVAIVLVFVPKTLEKQAEEAKAIKAMVEAD